MPKLKDSDTAALTRAAFPHICATGKNVTVEDIKRWVRQEHGKPDWNPSYPTVDTELKAIRSSIGLRMLDGVALPDVPEDVAGPFVDLATQMMCLFRKKAAEEVQEAHRELMRLQQQAADSVRQAEKETQDALDRLRVAQHDFELREARHVAANAALNAKVGELEVHVGQLQTNLAASNARGDSLQQENVRLIAERDADTKQHAAQLELADERFKALERMHHQEYDNARTARDRALADLDKQRAELLEAQTLASRKSIEAAELSGELKALKKALAAAEERSSHLEAGNPKRVLRKVAPARIAGQKRRSS